MQGFAEGGCQQYLLKFLSERLWIVEHQSHKESCVDLKIEDKDLNQVFKEVTSFQWLKAGYIFVLVSIRTTNIRWSPQSMYSSVVILKKMIKFIISF